MSKTLTCARRVRTVTARALRTSCIEINTRDRLFIPGARVVDLGAAPGGWSQVAAQKVAPGGKVIAVDLLEIAPISTVTVLRGDCREPEIQAQTGGRRWAGTRRTWCLSDLSPNISGIASADQARAAELVQMAMDFCREWLQKEGVFLVKVFQGEEFAGLLKETEAYVRGGPDAQACRIA